MSSKQKAIYRFFLVFICIVLGTDFIPKTGFTQRASAQVDERSLTENQISDKNSTLSAAHIPVSDILDRNTLVESQGIEIDYGKYCQNEELRSSISVLLQKDGESTLPGSVYVVTSERIENDWRLISVLSMNGPGCYNEELHTSYCSGLIIAHNELEKWQVELAGTPGFSSMIKQSPNSMIGPDAKNILDPLSKNISSIVDDRTYQFPWVAGEWQYWWGFPHSGCSNCIDLGTHGSSADRRVLTSTNGIISNIRSCNATYVVDITDFSGHTVSYFHLDVAAKPSGMTEGELMRRGQLLGQTKLGPFNDGTTCGYSPQGETSAHLHWANLPIDGTFIVDGWTLGTDAIWRKNGDSRTAKGDSVGEYETLLSENHILLKQLKYIFVPFPSQDSGWPYLIYVADPRVRTVKIDETDEVSFGQNSCNSFWWSFSEGEHKLEIWYELSGPGAPEIQIYPWPVTQIVPPACAASPGIDPPIQKTDDSAKLDADITLPDSTVSSPAQTLQKTWRMKNIGTSTWGSGYALVFINGEQMGAPSETSIPSTAPNQTVDLSIPITAPAAAGEHTGYFQLRNPQGTYFGPQIWVKINVRSASNKITILTADPPSPADTSTVRIRAKVEGIPNLRAIRLKVDGVVQGEFGGPEYIFTWDTQGFSAGDHNIVIEAADQTDTSWSHPEIRSMVYTLYGSTASPNLKPNAPSQVSPYDWYVYYSGDTAQLCAQENGDPDGDGISAYYFEIYESAQSWNSGWTGSNCVNTAALGPYNYKWHVKVSDNRGAESDLSSAWNFTLVNPNLTITDLSFEPQDANSEVVKIRACTAGLGGLGITMRVDVNDANDGSSNGQWHRIKELGVPCFNDIDAPIWQTLDAGGNFGDGWHLVRVEAHSANTGWDGAAVREATYYLPHRRPSRFPLVAPVSSDGNYNTPVFLNSPTVAFQWGGALRASTYTLSIGLEQNPANSSNPLYRQTFGSDVTQQTVTLADNYPTIYWQVRATNDKGYIDSESQRIGIDQTSPECWMHTLSEVSYENNVQVNWEGDDTPAGIFSYDIQYLDSNRGVWSDWLTAVPANKTYELFSGQAGHSYSFRCRATDYAGIVGSFETSGVGTIKIDPAARPVEAWWREWYETKRSVTIQNNMPSADLPAFYPVQVRLTSGTSPSAADIYNASTAAIKCDDLRIVFNNDTEIPRFIKRCSPDEIEIWFRTETIVPAGSTSAAYQIYVGNPAASNPPGNPTLVWYPYPEGDTTNLYLFQEGSGSTALDYSGNGRDCTINPSVGWSTGKWGSGLNFQQANNGNTVSLTCGSPYPIYSLTAEMWFKSDSSFYNSDGRLAGQLGPNNQLSWLFSVEGSKLKFERWCNGGSQQARGNIDLHREPYLSQWNHIAITFDGGNQVNFYVNGVLDNAVTLYDSCNETHNIPLEIGSVEGFGQGYYTLGAFKLSNTVKTNFYPGTFANITNEPSTAVGLLILPPATGVADLAVESLATFPLLTGGILVEAGVRNVGSVSTINGFYTDLYLNHVPIGGDDFVGSVNFWVNDPIPAGGTTTLSTVITDLGQLGLNASMPGEEQTGILYAQTDSTSALTEPDKQNNIFSNGVEVCVATADAYESNDNSPAEAGWIEDTQLHNFDRPEDEDWLKLDMIKGQFYSISTSDLGLTADTYLYLYDQDGMTLLAYNDDIPGSLSSEIEWIAPVDGTYYILVKQWNQSVWGCGTSWSITVQNLTTPDLIYRTYLPLTSNYNPNQITVYGMAEDVETGMIGCSWSDCFTSSMADFIYQGYPVGTVAGSKNDNETYTLKKIFLFFDTSAIPDTATINSITFGIKTGPYLNGNPSVFLVKSNANIPVQYSDLNRYINNYSLIRFSPEVETWQNETVIPSRSDWIDKTGVTKLALVEFSEIVQIAPNSVNDAVFYLAEDTANRPYLTIEFSP